MNDAHLTASTLTGQKNALLQAQQIAQARAAHNQAILDGLDAFRGTNRDPNAHYWDEVRRCDVVHNELL